MVLRFVSFLILNFLALYIGGSFTQDGIISDWYLNLNIAPWTPPGWAFGFAWTIIMIFFAMYLTYLFDTENKPTIITLFLLQWILNVAWNPVFFYFQKPLLGLLIIILLTIVVVTFLLKHLKNRPRTTLWIAPYILWLFVAISLNAYIVLNN